MHNGPFCGATGVDAGTRAGLPDAEPHHHHAQREPSKYPDGDQRFEADTLVFFTYLSLDLVFVHAETSERWKVGAARYISRVVLEQASCLFEVDEFRQSEDR